MKPSDLKPHVLAAVELAAEANAAVKFDDVRVSIGVYGHPFDNRDLDRALQALRREKKIQYLGKRDPKTGKPRKRWGWQPVTKRGAHG